MMTEIVPGIFVGDGDMANTGPFKRVINCAAELRNLGKAPFYFHIPLQDTGEFEDQRVFCRFVQRAINFTERAEGDPVLIHCQMGMSRSPSIALAILLDREPVHDRDTYTRLVKFLVFDGGPLQV